MKLKTEIDGALHVAKDVLDKRKMGLTRSMHVEANLLHSISYIWTRQCEVLECAGQAPVLGRIKNRGPIRGG